MTARTRTRPDRTVYVCSECGAQASKWAGQCGDCGAWNTLSEERLAGKGDRQVLYSGFAGQLSQVQSLSDIETTDRLSRPTGFSELDRVLGSGLVPGAVVLIGGDPGIGKSTLLQQAMASLSRSLSTLYVTGEESLQQIGLRAQRLGAGHEAMRLLAETRVEQILLHADREKPQVMVVDSIQTVYTSQLPAAPGSVSQLRESAAQLVQYAKLSGTALFLVGHVTKEGALAGPRILEHMVDTVLYFEGNSDSRYRVVRAVKNRFGAVNEVGVFAMTDRGLREVSNPSAIFVSHHDRPVPGSVVMITREGSRPMLVEVQALVAESHAPNPRRLSVGLDQNRLAMLLAVLQRHGGPAMYDQDVFVNVVGGVRITETAADLAVVLAAVSSMRNKPLPSGLAVFGEIGLAGEIRPVQNGQERWKEAVRHGFNRVLVPKGNVPKKRPDGIDVIAVQRLDEALEAVAGL